MYYLINPIRQIVSIAKQKIYLSFQTVQKIHIPIIDDKKINEKDEVFWVHLRTKSKNTFIKDYKSLAEVTIKDNDKLTVQESHTRRKRKLHNFFHAKYFSRELYGFRVLIFFDFLGVCFSQHCTDEKGNPRTLRPTKINIPGARSLDEDGRRFECQIEAEVKKTRIDRRVAYGRAADQDKVTAYQYKTGGNCEYFTEPVKHKGLDAIKEDAKARSLGGAIENTECCVWTKGKIREKRDVVSCSIRV